jgi:hypothetical protein
LKNTKKILLIKLIHFEVSAQIFNGILFWNWNLRNFFFCWCLVNEIYLRRIFLLKWVWWEVLWKPIKLYSKWKINLRINKNNFYLFIERNLKYFNNKKIRFDSYTFNIISNLIMKEPYFFAVFLFEAKFKTCKKNYNKN